MRLFLDNTIQFLYFMRNQTTEFFYLHIKRIWDVLGDVGLVRAGWRQVLDYSAWFGVKSGLDESIFIYPDGGVQEVNPFGVEVIVDSLLTLELYSWMEGVQEINKDKKFFLGSLSLAGMHCVGAGCGRYGDFGLLRMVKIPQCHFGEIPAPAAETLS